MAKIECDSSSCFFCQSCLPEWRALTQLKKQTKLYKKGESIFTEGEKVKGMFFTLSGATKVHKKWGNQKDIIIRFTSGVDAIGIRGFGDKFYRVSATALEQTKACFIPTDHLEASLNTNPALCYKLMQFYASELQSAEQRMNDLAHLDTKGRTATAILMLQKTYGNSTDGYINITISRQDIASYAGTIYETIFKIFTEWTGAGVIATDGKRIKILNQDLLNTFIA